MRKELKTEDACAHRRAHRPRTPTNLVSRGSPSALPLFGGLPFFACRRSLLRVSELDLGVDVARLGDLGVADAVLVGVCEDWLLEVLLHAEDLRATT